MAIDALVFLSEPRAWRSSEVVPPLALINVRDSNSHDRAVSSKVVP